MNWRAFRMAFVCATVLLVPLSVKAQAGNSGESVVVASIKGTAVTEEELTKAAAKDLAKLELEKTQFNAGWERDRHHVLETNLSRLLEEKLLQAEAARKGMTKEQWLDMELQGKVKDPTDEEVKSFYESNRQRISQPFPQISTQIHDYLKAQNYNSAKADLVERLKKTYDVNVSLQPLRVKVDTEGSPSRGPAEAPVTLVEFSDFQCPYCAALSETLHRILNQYGSQVRLVYRNFPLSQIHPNAEKAAIAGICAAEQDRFWPMHDLMFQTQGQLKDEDLKAKAARLNLNLESFSACMAQEKNAVKLQQDLHAGFSLGVTGTPALFINGRFVSGAVPFDELTRIINEELKLTSRAKQVSLAAK